MVIEDSQYARVLLTSELQKHGFHVVAVENAELGQLEIAQRQPDVIILDLNLPSLGGEDLGLIVRGTAATARIPVLIFSGVSETEIRQAVALTGAQGYVRKSQDIDGCVQQLVKKIKVLLARRR